MNLEYIDVFYQLGSIYDFLVSYKPFSIGHLCFFVTISCEQYDMLSRVSLEDGLDDQWLLMMLRNVAK